MPDCQCDRLDRTFDTKTARNDLRDYLRDGPDSSTQQLLGALRKGGVEGRTLLDIGGGVGTIQLELLGAGLAAATDVDVSGAYIEVARLEAAKRGFADRTAYYHGDFVEYAAEVPAADIVTLDRVICCYPDLDRLAARAAERAQERLGLVHPRDYWWMRAAMTLYNAAGRLFRAPRFFVHRTARLEAILQTAGLEREWSGGTRFWRVAVYRRVTRDPERLT
jgi:magnesium-protoporphyrin O-methyltransferase